MNALAYRSAIESFCCFLVCGLCVVGWRDCTKNSAAILSYRLFAPDNCTPSPYIGSPRLLSRFLLSIFCHKQMPIIMSDYIKARDSAKKKQFLLPHMRYRKMDFKRLSVRSLAIFISDGFCFLFPFHTSHSIWYMDVPIHVFVFSSCHIVPHTRQE